MYCYATCVAQCCCVSCVEISCTVWLGRGVTTELPMGDSHARPLPPLPCNAMGYNAEENHMIPCCIKPLWISVQAQMHSESHFTFDTPFNALLDRILFILCATLVFSCYSLQYRIQRQCASCQSHATLGQFHQDCTIAISIGWLFTHMAGKI